MSQFFRNWQCATSYVNWTLLCWTWNIYFIIQYQIFFYPQVAPISRRLPPPAATPQTSPAPKPLRWVMRWPGTLWLVNVSGWTESNQESSPILERPSFPQDSGLEWCWMTWLEKMMAPSMECDTSSASLCRAFSPGLPSSHDNPSETGAMSSSRTHSCSVVHLVSVWSCHSEKACSTAP